MITFFLISRNQHVQSPGRNKAYLKIDHWNDYSFVTMFYLTVYDQEGQKIEIGNIKIGFKGQTTETATYTTLENSFSSLDATYFSLGVDKDFYKNMHALSPPLREATLIALNDIVFNPSIIEKIRDEEVFGTSLLRESSLSIIKGQFSRILAGNPPLTDFNFSFHRPKQQHMSEVLLDFKVKESSTPSTNIHAIIGRNGVGKTTILNDMILSVISSENASATFYEERTISWTSEKKKIDSDYFSSLVSVSFSAFDPFQPPQEQPNPAKGACYFYIGLKSREDPTKHCSIGELTRKCSDSLVECFSVANKATRWEKAIDKLGSDENFAYMNLPELRMKYQALKDEGVGSADIASRYYQRVEPFLRRMSSGHAIVLLTTTKLVATVEEKTLVLLDEPESHLHPPLLSAFIRALSELLYDRNGVAIIATHSPVVLQEIPKSCVWKISRCGLETKCERPERETFGENVGILTREVFGLEVSKSGFFALLAETVRHGGAYEDIVHAYNDQLGMEGRALLKSLIVSRDASSGSGA